VPITERVGNLIGLWFEPVKVEEADAPDEPNIWIKIATTNVFQRSLSGIFGSGKIAPDRTIPVKRSGCVECHSPP
jgi:hypothetical protein